MPQSATAPKALRAGGLQQKNIDFEGGELGSSLNSLILRTSLVANQNETRRTEQSAPGVANFCALLGQVSRTYHPDVRTRNNGSNRRSADWGWPPCTRYWWRQRRTIAHHLGDRRTDRIGNVHGSGSWHGRVGSGGSRPARPDQHSVQAMFGQRSAIPRSDF